MANKYGEVATEGTLAALSHSDEDDNMYLMQATKRVRQDIFDKEKTFAGNFDKTCQTNSCPKKLANACWTFSANKLNAFKRK